MRRKRILSAFLSVCLLLGCCVISAGAVDGSYETFDYRAYANIYPDLKAAYGYDAEKLYAHYVNYGKAEGRVGTFISDSNPKTGAAIYGMTSGSNVQSKDPAQAVVPATLLNPLPPTELSKQPEWSGEQCTHFSRMSNAKLVAEMLSAKSYMAEARAAREAGTTGGKANWLNDTVMVTVDYIELELTGRIEALEYGRNNAHYQRAMVSDTAILTQYASNYYGLAAPPADPGALPGETAEKPAVTTVGGFSDVLESDYFAQPVLWAVERNITNGTSATTFSPNSPCTQAQILTFIWRAEGSPEPAGTVEAEGFDGTEYYYKAALWAAEQGMIEGEFDPGTLCTRSMAVTYLWKQAGSPAVAATASFTDVPAGAAYAQAVAWALEKGITNGTSATTFGPDASCSRGQIMTFLYRALVG